MKYTTSCVCLLYAITIFTCTIQIQANDADTCAICPGDHYCSEGSIKDCPIYSGSNTESTLRTDCSCKAGYYGIIDMESGGCEICPKGTYCPGGPLYGNSKNECRDSSSTVSEGSTSKSDCICNVGFYKPAGQESCELCLPWFFCVGDENLQTCPANTESSSGSIAITDCKCKLGNYAGGDGMECTPCQPGKYKPVIGAGICTPCPTGTWSDKYEASSVNTCLSCGADSVSVEASDEIKDCKCRPGFTGSNGGTCSQCTEGTYKSVNGDASCTPCGYATFSTSLGATSSSTCTS